MLSKRSTFYLDHYIIVCMAISLGYITCIRKTQFELAAVSVYTQFDVIKLF